MLFRSFVRKNLLYRIMDWLKHKSPLQRNTYPLKRQEKNASKNVVCRSGLLQIIA